MKFDCPADLGFPPDLFPSWRDFQAEAIQETHDQLESHGQVMLGAPTGEGLQEIEVTHSEVLGMMPDGSFSYHPVIATKDEGQQDTLKLSTQCGYIFEGSPYHNLMTLQNGKLVWVKLAEMKEGQIVGIYKGAVLGGNPLPSFTSAYLLGLYTAEGYIHPCGNAMISNWNSDIKKAAIEECRVATLACSEVKAGINIRSKWFGEIAAKWCGNGSHQKKIPLEIFQAPLIERQAFLAGIFDLPSNILISKSGKSSPALRI